MELDNENTPPEEVVETSITFRLCKRPFLRGIKGTFEASFPKVLFELILYHLDIMYLDNFCLVNKAFYEYLNPLGGCIAVCCDEYNIDSDLLDLLYEQFEAFLHWYTLKYGKQTTTIFGLILCHDNWPRDIDPKKLHYGSSPNGNLHSKFNECTNLIGLNLAYHLYIPDPSSIISLKRSYNPKLSEYLSMDLIINTRLKISISCEKSKYIHVNVSPDYTEYTDSKKHQDDALETGEYTENYFMKHGKLPKCVDFGGLIRINDCHNLNEA
jgi:hypothetical protein